MNFVISPGARTGAVRIPASKSQAHRLLICAALGKAPVTVRCDGLNADILATAACLRALGANIAEQDGALRVEPDQSSAGRPLCSALRRERIDAPVFAPGRWRARRRRGVPAGRAAARAPARAAFERACPRRHDVLIRGREALLLRKTRAGRIYASRKHFLAVHFRAAFRAAAPCRGQHAHDHWRARERGLYRHDGKRSCAKRHPAI